MSAKSIALLLSVLMSAALSSPVSAAESPGAAVRPRLQHLLEVAARNTHKHFIMAAVPGAWPDLSWYGVEDGAVSYPVLLTILADNNLAAVDDGGMVNIVPLFNIRSYPTLTLTARELEKTHLPDDQVISVLIHVEHIDAAKLVPVLRPLIPQWGQLSATEPNTLIMTGTFANARRIAYMVRSLDQPVSANGPRTQP